MTKSGHCLETLDCLLKQKGYKNLKQLNRSRKKPNKLYGPGLNKGGKILRKCWFLLDYLKNQ